MRGTTDLEGRFSLPDMRWQMEFYHERRGILARYAVEAPLPEAAVVLGRRALFAEYPPTTRPKGRLSLFKQAQGIEGQDPSGWILYRIGGEGGSGSPAAPAPAT
jgi:hypothetical protein